MNTNNNVKNAIFVAVQTNNPGLLFLLLQQQRNPILYTHGVNQYGQRPLDVALMGNPSFRIVDILLRARSYVMAENIVAAARSRRQDILQLLCSQGSNLINRANDNGWNPLQIAIAEPNCNYQTIDLLLFNRANPNMERPLTALHIAILHGQNLFVIVPLLRHRANPNATNGNGQTALHAALAMRYNFTIIQWLVAFGGDVNTTDGFGQTLLHNAIISRDRAYEIRWMLRHAHANGHARNPTNKTPLHLYALLGERPTMFNPHPHYINSNDHSIFSTLMDTRPDVNALDFEGKTPLYYASGAGHEAIVRALLRNYANPNLSSPANGIYEFPLFTALENNRERIFRILLQNGANPDIANAHGETCLHRAVAKLGKIKFFQLLIRHNCNVNATNTHGVTALHIAVQLGKKTMTQRLLRCQANVYLPDTNGRTPLHWAVSTSSAPLSALEWLVSSSLTPLDLHIGDRFERTPLHLALFHQQSADVVYSLIRRDPTQLKFP